MVFSSSVFLFFFLPVLLVLYFLAEKKYKNPLLLAASILFYSWGGPRFIFVILLTTLACFYLVAWMHASTTRWKKRLLLTVAVILNVGLLVYFKYMNFFVENFDLVLAGLGLKPVAFTRLVLPIGISFFTFETVTYIVDVYRGVHAPLKNFWEYQLYIILFPKLIAGPIIRYHEIADQITDRSANETTDNRITGFFRFVTGLAKKVLIANVVGEVADKVFAMDPSGISTVTAWTGALAYTFQIYFDFSGYSDMAIGLCRMLGFRISENFNNPYTSRSITEFWRRWHITLGAWMRNYLYIPLGGNRVKTRRRLYFNLWFVFLASGLWHGASWTFIIWGAYHGLFLVLERIFLLKIYDKVGKVPSMLLTFLVVIIGWVFFRVEDLQLASGFVQRMFAFSGYLPDLYLTTHFLTVFIVAFVLSFFASAKKGLQAQEWFYASMHTARGYAVLLPAILLFYILSVASITAEGFNPFIYFRF
jgi:alginate O-acetyltransferase complex protein AlgI